MFPNGKEEQLQHSCKQGEKKKHGGCCRGQTGWNTFLKFEMWWSGTTKKKLNKNKMTMKDLGFGPFEAWKHHQVLESSMSIHDSKKQRKTHCCLHWARLARFWFWQQFKWQGWGWSCFAEKASKTRQRKQTDNSRKQMIYDGRRGRWVQFGLLFPNTCDFWKNCFSCWQESRSDAHNWHSHALILAGFNKASFCPLTIVDDKLKLNAAATEIVALLGKTQWQPHQIFVVAVMSFSECSTDVLSLCCHCFLLTSWWQSQAKWAASQTFCVGHNAMSEVVRWTEVCFVPWPNLWVFRGKLTTQTLASNRDFQNVLVLVTRMHIVKCNVSSLNDMSRQCDWKNSGCFY